MELPYSPYETQTIVVEAPIAEVWRVLAHEFERVGEWASRIRYSKPIEGKISDQNVDAASPVPGRIIGLAGLGDVTEIIVGYSESDHTLTYVGVGLPRWLGVARVTWFAEAIDPQTTRAGFRPLAESKGVVGRLVLAVIDLISGWLSANYLEDLKHFVETGNPSPRKQKELDKRR